MEGRTVFVIAHRLSTVRNSNAIMVLEKGRIIERGDHEELLRRKGRYYELYTGMFELSWLLRRNSNSSVYSMYFDWCITRTERKLKGTVETNRHGSLFDAVDSIIPNAHWNSMY